ncbi:MAG: bifunctional DNA-formamidopyrimidine glycosylase/DNA-(apurinic or apyrimidinic site) lyase [Lactobacillus sp.]|jgi:formamidopyrimidine-DNA glycosylase|nr:bifunctional DNA-formamidopyrimidine glycosylase/DNA-(apurinic or apyrimidinic site) lyase [Lactobacillus sp.]
MPELPEVETIKRALEKAVLNSDISKVKVLCNKFRIKVPDDFAKRIEGAKIIKIKRIAKYMVIDLDNGESIIWHLGMSGRVKICDKESYTLEKHDHIVIETTKGTLIYNDARRFGLITVIKTDMLGECSLLSQIGLDPFDENLDAKFLHDKLKGKSIPIKVALLDQKIINGIGNIYASEALYMARIMPTREAKDIKPKECKVLIEAVRIVLKKAIEAGGSTLRDYKKPDGSMGYFQNLHCVYNKTGQQCSDCTCDIKKTGGVKKIVQAGRSTFYCPVLQK